MNRGESRAVLAVAVILTFVIRCFSFRNFQNPDGGFFFYSIDSYDHLRRITLGINNFPALANFDYYAAFPHGLGQIWSPGFDYLLSFLCYLAGGGRALTETICFFFNPLAAAGVVLAVFFVARGIFRSEVAAAVAALVLSLHPAYIAYSLPMNFDHHAIEPLVALALFALPLIEPRRQAPWRFLLMTAGVLLLAIIFWRGSTLYWGLFFASALARVYVAKSRSLALLYAAVFALTALVVALYCLVNPWGGARQFSFAVISWFHVLALSLWSVIFLVFSLSRTRLRFMGWLGVFVVVMAVACVVGPVGKLAAQFFEGLSFVRGQGDPWLDSNSELRGVFQSRYSLLYSSTYLTAFWFMAPGSVLIVARKWRREGHVDPMLLNFVLWSPALAMGLTLRYSHIAGVFSSISAGFLAHYLFHAHRASRLRWGLALSVLALLLPGIPHYKEAMSADLPDAIKFGLYGADGLIPWLRNNTPPTSYWLDPVHKPEYGVLARWSLGARLYQDAQRPSLSTAFGWETYGFYQEAGFWATEDESKAMKILGESQVRYVVAQAVHDLRTDHALALQGQQRGDLPPDIVGGLFRRERSMQTRLMHGDGSMMKMDDGVMLPALGGLRLIHESGYLARGEDGMSLAMSYYKLFEAVRGAVISGKAGDSEQVVVSLALETGRGRRWAYLARTHAAANGDFAIRVPYSTKVRQGDVTPLGPYEVYVGREKKGEIAVSEADVATGGMARFE